MKVFFWDDILNATIPNSPCYNYFKSSALTIGGFDGPHIGHKSLCQRVLDYAGEHNVQSGVVTFAHSPRMLKEKNRYAGDISTLRLRLKTFEKWGFDFVVVIDFSKNFSKIEGVAFLRILADYCAMQFLTVGEGFRCGYKGETDTAHIENFARENNIYFLLAPLIHVSLHNISSSVIRNHIVNGRLRKCNDLLGFPYALDIKHVICDLEKKSSTAYIQIERTIINQVLPPDGEYNVSVLVQNSVKSFSSILYLDNINLRLHVPKEFENEQFDVITFE